MSLFNGVGVAMVTPFSETGVNYAETERLVEHIIAGGAAALFALGTTGAPRLPLTEMEPAHAETLLKVMRQLNIVGGKA